MDSGRDCILVGVDEEWEVCVERFEIGNAD